MGSSGIDIVHVLNGRIYRDTVGSLEGMNSGAGSSYHDCFLSLGEKSYICIKNRGSERLNLCIPACESHEGRILEMNPGTENQLSASCFRQNSGSCITFAALGQDDMSQSRLSLTAEQFSIGNKDLTYNAYQLQVTSEGICIRPRELGIAELLSVYIITENGIELDIKGKIRAEEREETLFYHLPFGDVSINKGDRIRRLELVFAVNFKEEEETDMGIISTLLSGGVLVGKLCQAAVSALSGGNNSNYVDAETGIVFAEAPFMYDNMKFYMKRNGDATQYMAVNQDENSVKLMQFPANEDGSSLVYEMEPFAPVEVGTDLKYCREPDSTIGLSTTETANLAKDGAVNLRLRIHNIKIDDADSCNDINGYVVSVKKDGIQIKTGRTEPTSLISFRATSESGIEIACDQSIAPETADDVVLKYPIDFESYAVESGEHIDGELVLGLSGDSYHAFMEKGKELRKRRNMADGLNGDDNEDFAADLRFLKFLGEK